MFWKEDMRLVDFQEGEFLQRKFVKIMNREEFPVKLQARGIPEVKKNAIIGKLCPLMEAHHIKYWSNIPTSEVADLVDNE